MKIKDEIKVKHVMGELTLEDVWNLVVRDCGWIGVMSGDFDEVYAKFNMDGETLTLWASFSNRDPDWVFPGDTKVKAKEDHVEFDDPHDPGVKIKLTFGRMEPIRLEILQSAREHA